MTNPSPEACAEGLRPILEAVARQGTTLTYLDLARAAGIKPPRAIHRTTEALEAMMRADRAAGRPLLAAVVVSAKRAGLPAPGFFRLAGELGLYFGPDHGPQAALFHAMEVERVRAALGRGTGS
ncbi:hypothetical protein [Thalassobaculum sp.]|uniref:hypothetical protein n=1 Tax=Thalassobaculum sp. TaxID=2022740 RepID=UPI0032EC915E